MQAVRLLSPRKVALLSFISLGVLSSELHSATFLVTSTSDSGTGSLRQAILDANTSGGGDITFSNLTGSIVLAASLPEVANDVRILGPGATSLTVSGTGIFRALSFGT